MDASRKSAYPEMNFNKSIQKELAVFILIKTFSLIL
jgi:hypothetical protein